MFMCILLPVVAAVVLVFFGYLAMWSASQANTPAGISQFGKIMSIILFVFAGLILVSGVARRNHSGMSCMMEKMNCSRGEGDMKGKMWHHGFGFGQMRDMDKQSACCDKEQLACPAVSALETKSIKK
jgi:hypothetical protein